MNVGVVGCGLIGQKRVRALGPEHCLIAVADCQVERATRLASPAKSVQASADWRDVISAPGVDIVIVATTNRELAPIGLAAIEAGKHVLIEKPAARRAEEIEPLIAAARRKGVRVAVGFNHRFHPALRKAREIFDAGSIGPLMFVRGRYGHGGRVGYDREWRADPEIAGGGELLDQGVHLIDLARWFLGEFVSVSGEAHTFFWDMTVEDNGFMSLKTESGQVAWLHASCTEWKNLFSFEVYGRTGKLHVEGLGGSYGVERLAFYRMRPEMGPPETTIWEFPGEDTSFREEFESFVTSIQGGEFVGAGLEDARAALEVVEEIYRRSGK